MGTRKLKVTKRRLVGGGSETAAKDPQFDKKGTIGGRTRRQKKIYYILIYLCGLHAGRAKKSVADNVRGQIVYKIFFKFRVKNVWFTNNFDVLIGEVLP